MAHLNGTPRHMIVWSFAFQAKYAPAHVLFKYILEMKPLTIYVGTPPEARLNSRLSTHLHNICFAKTSHESKERCQFVWDYVTGKGEALENNYAGVLDDSGCAPDFARCLVPYSLDGLNVLPLSFVTVPSLSRLYNTDDPPSLLHWMVCLSFLQQLLAHQNFSRVCTTFLLCHFHVSTGRLRLHRRS